MSEYNAEQAVRIADARDAVVEAAGVYVHMDPFSPKRGEVFHRLHLTIEALEAAEEE
jgi:hypothetical protein